MKKKAAGAAGHQKKTKEPRAKARNRVTRGRKRNPGDETGAAARLFERFTGRKATTERTVAELHQEPTELAVLGTLISLEVKRPGEVLTFEPRGVKVTATGNGGQIYFVGGDQRLDLAGLGLGKLLPKDHITIGEARRIVYRTSKAFHNFEPTDYVHRFGEEGGQEPTLCYDVLNAKLYLSGGSYQVRPEGIVN